jgi:hypothetical protein
VLDSQPSQLILVVLGTLVSRRSLEGRVKTITAVVDRPDRDSIGNWSGLTVRDGEIVSLIGIRNTPA